MNKKKILIPLAVVGAVALAAGITIPRLIRSSVDQLMTGNRETVPVETRTLVESISATGTVTSEKHKEVVAGLTGVKVTEVLVEEGDRVKKGDPLCTFDLEDFEYDLDMTKDALEVSTGINAINSNAAARALKEAQEQRSIEIERADKDTAKAWEDYMEALTDFEEAENDWNNAKQTVMEKNGELELRKRRLAEAEESGAAEAAAQAEALASQAGAVTAAQDAAKAEIASKFAEAVATLNAAISATEDISANPGTLDRVYLTSGHLGSISAVNDFTYSSDSEETNAKNRATVEQALSALNTLQAQYNEAAQAPSAIPQASPAVPQVNTDALTALAQEVAEWEAKVAAAKQAEAAAEAAWTQMKAQSEAMQTAYEQRVRLTDDTKRNLDSAVAAREDAVKTAALNGRLTGQTEKRSIRQLEAQLEEGTALAPMDGIITAVNVEEGMRYTGTAIASIEDVSGYEITSEISEYDIGKLEPGQRVVIKTNGTGDEELDGKIVRIAPRASGASAATALPGATGTTASFTGGDVTYKVAIEMLDKNDLIRMDMTAKLSIIIKEAKDVLTVPFDAIQEDEDGTLFVDEITEEHADDPKTPPETRRVEVERGIESDYYVEIISDELSTDSKILMPENTENSNLYELMGIEDPMDGL